MTQVKTKRQAQMQAVTQGRFRLWRTVDWLILCICGVKFYTPSGLTVRLKNKNVVLQSLHWLRNIAEEVILLIVVVNLREFTDCCARSL